MLISTFKARMKNKRQATNISSSRCLCGFSLCRPTPAFICFYVKKNLVRASRALSCYPKTAVSANVSPFNPKRRYGHRLDPARLRTFTRPRMFRQMFRERYLPREANTSVVTENAPSRGLYLYVRVCVRVDKYRCVSRTVLTLTTGFDVTGVFISSCSARK